MKFSLLLHLLYIQTSFSYQISNEEAYIRSSFGASTAEKLWPSYVTFIWLQNYMILCKKCDVIKQPYFSVFCERQSFFNDFSKIKKMSITFCSYYTSRDASFAYLSYTMQLVNFLTFVTNCNSRNKFSFKKVQCKTKQIQDIPLSLTLVLVSRLN